jgi:hypothetical protein
MDTLYNGWKNRETWNVNLWLANDERLYQMVLAYSQMARDGHELGLSKMNYRDFATNYLVYTSAGTPDGVAWLDESLDYEALDELLEEMG